MKHSKRKIAAEQSRRAHHRKPKEEAGEASKAQSPMDTPEPSEAIRRGFTAADMEQRKGVLDSMSHAEVLNLAATMPAMIDAMRNQGREDLAQGIEEELSVVHEYVRAFILSKIRPKGTGAMGSGYVYRIQSTELH